ncbi:MAG: hypothetical protein AB3N18_03780 [Allomuricauda sp.]
MKKIQNINDYLAGFVIGIRYRANFSIEDSLGEIVDKILYSKNAFFNSKRFPLVRNNGNEKILFNDHTGDRLTINNSNIILDVVFDDAFKKEDYSEILKKFNTDIIDGIMKTYKITEINRMGVIHRYLFDDKELAKSFIDKTIGQTLDGVNDINLTFSRKFPVNEAMIKKEVYDYTNVIFNIIKKADKDDMILSVDYQKYFDPFLTTSQDMKFESYVKAMEKFNSKNYVDWLNQNYISHE